MWSAVALGWSSWRGTPVLQHREFQVQQRCFKGPSRVVAASLDSDIVSSSSVVGKALVELHRTVLQGSVSSHSSVEWWAVAAPAALWFMFAAPGSFAGVGEFLTSPLHSLRHREFAAGAIEVGRRIGEGSFGVVYEGYISQGKGAERLHVVLKKAKSDVSNSSEMHNTEVHMNRYLQRNAPQAVADFLGTVQVKRSEVKGRLTEGLWLIWKFQGYHTLDHYMKQRTFPDNVGKLVLGDSAWYQPKREKQDGVVLRTIMYHILFNLQQIHRTGVVHRDVKPLNLILAEDSDTFKLVDLGACVNLRSGFNYVPNETIMDPVYAPPEQYVMPTATPRLPPDPLCSLISPLVWLLNTPDRFDLFSAGLVMMQLSVKPLRQDTEMKHFTAELKKAGYDLNKWRKQCRYPKGEFALLDADDGSGWELVTALLQPRHDKAFIIWPSIVGSRPSAGAALRHRFFRGVALGSVPVKLDIFETVPRVIGEGLVPALSSTLAQLRELETDSKQLEALQDKVVAQMSATLTRVKSKEFTSAVTAAVPLVALSSLGISSSWMLVQYLESSAQVSYDVTRNFVDSIGISGPVSVAFFLLVKPLLEQRQTSSAKARERERKLSSLAAKDSDYEQVTSLAETVVALDSRLDSLEALVVLNNEQYYKQQVTRMRSLLAQQV